MAGSKIMARSAFKQQTGSSLPAALRQSCDAVRHAIFFCVENR